MAEFQDGGLHMIIQDGGISRWRPPYEVPKWWIIWTPPSLKMDAYIDHPF